MYEFVTQITRPINSSSSSYPFIHYPFHLIRRESPFSSRESLFIAPPPSFQYSFHCSFELPYIRDLLETGEDTRDDFDDLFLRQKKRKGERRGEERREERTIVVTTCTPIPKKGAFSGVRHPDLHQWDIYIYIRIHEARNVPLSADPCARRTHARTHAEARVLMDANLSSGKGLCPMICSGTIMPQLPDTLTHPPPILQPCRTAPLRAKRGKHEPIPPPFLRPASNT